MLTNKERSETARQLKRLRRHTDEMAQIVSGLPDEPTLVDVSQLKLPYLAWAEEFNNILVELAAKVRD